MWFSLFSRSTIVLTGACVLSGSTHIPLWVNRSLHSICAVLGQIRIVLGLKAVMKYFHRIPHLYLIYGTIYTHLLCMLSVPCGMRCVLCVCPCSLGGRRVWVIWVIWIILSSAVNSLRYLVISAWSVIHASVLYVVSDHFCCSLVAPISMLFPGGPAWCQSRSVRPFLWNWLCRISLVSLGR